MKETKAESTQSDRLREITPHHNGNSYFVHLKRGTRLDEAIYTIRGISNGLDITTFLSILATF